VSVQAYPLSEPRGQALATTQIKTKMNQVKLEFLSLTLFAGTLAIYLSLPTKNYFYDGVGFAQTIEDSPQLGPSLIHPNHLIYNVMGYLIYKAARGLRLEIRALKVMQITNSILSAVSAYVLFHILMSALGSVYLSSLLTLLFSFSATWWKFSTDADSYIASVFFLLICLYLLRPRHSHKPILLALTHSVAMLFHQLAVLFYPVALLGIALQTSPLRLRRRVFPLFQYSIVAFLLTSSAYYFGFYLQHGKLDVKSFAGWVTSYSPEASFSLDLWRDLIFTLRGHIRLFLGGRLSLVPVQPFTILFASVFLFLIGALCISLIINRREIKLFFTTALKCDQRFRPLMLLATVWIATYLAFLFFWLPNNTYYRLFYLPAIIVLCGIVFAQYDAVNRGKRRHSAALLTAAVAIFNLTFYIFPSSRVQANQPLTSALAMKPLWTGGTVIYYEVFNTDDWTLRYFNPQTEWRKLESEELSALEDDLQQIYGSGGTAWAETTAIDVLASEESGWLSSHIREELKYEWVNQRHRIRLFQIVPRMDNHLPGVL
jgi:hypothetical protein